MASDPKEVVLDLSPLIKVYKDGTVEDLLHTPPAPPSPEDPATGVSSKDITISPIVSARLHLPKLKTPNEKLPILIYYHGGGFLVGSAFDKLVHEYANILASEANALVVSVEYRLAKQEQFLPAAYDDCWAATQWVASHADDKNAEIQRDPWLVGQGDFSRLFIAGDSAGGNIAHNIAMRAGAEALPGGVKITGAILAHPYFWGSKTISTMTRESNQENGYTKVWLYVYPMAPGGIGCPLINPLAENSPSLENLGVSKLFLCTAEKDLLRERVHQYVEAVKKSGWRGEVAEVVEADGEDHCYQLFNPHTEKAKHVIKRMAAFILQ